MARALRLPPPERCVELFAVANLAFLGVDIALAHAENAFAKRVEWAPIVFSAIGTLLVLPAAAGARARIFRQLEIAIGVFAIAIGVTGMVLHLESAFFVQQTIGNLVYSAPFVAPLAYIGVGLLLLLVRLEDPATPVFGWWIVLLALGGFFGNFTLSLLDHAQNAFFRWTEWVPVFAAAFATSFLLVVLVRPSTPVLKATNGLLAFEAVVGLVGFVLHVTADFRRPAVALTDRFLYGAPAFAPLLFTNLALLGAIGIWASERAARPSRG